MMHKNPIEWPTRATFASIVIDAGFNHPQFLRCVRVDNIYQVALPHTMYFYRIDISCSTNSQTSSTKYLFIFLRTLYILWAFIGHFHLFVTHLVTKPCILWTLAQLHLNWLVSLYGASIELSIKVCCGWANKCLTLVTPQQCLGLGFRV